jgi:hypothetical protein
VIFKFHERRLNSFTSATCLYVSLSEQKKVASKLTLSQCKKYKMLPTPVVVFSYSFIQFEGQCIYIPFHMHNAYYKTGQIWQSTYQYSNYTHTYMHMCACTHTHTHTHTHKTSLWLLWTLYLLQALKHLSHYITCTCKLFTYCVLTS